MNAACYFESSEIFPDEIFGLILGSILHLEELNCRETVSLPGNPAASVP
jgi:hypothetical protein